MSRLPQAGASGLAPGPKRPQPEGFESRLRPPSRTEIHIDVERIKNIRSRLKDQLSSSDPVETKEISPEKTLKRTLTGTNALGLNKKTKLVPSPNKPSRAGATQTAPRTYSYNRPTAASKNQKTPPKKIASQPTSRGLRPPVKNSRSNTSISSLDNSANFADLSYCSNLSDVPKPKAVKRHPTDLRVYLFLIVF